MGNNLIGYSLMGNSLSESNLMGNSLKRYSLGYCNLRRNCLTINSLMGDSLRGNSLRRNSLGKSQGKLDQYLNWKNNISIIILSIERTPVFPEINVKLEISSCGFIHFKYMNWIYVKYLSSTYFLVHKIASCSVWQIISTQSILNFFIQVTHWQHPRFHAYFPSGNSYPSILGDMLSDAIGCIG